METPENGRKRPNIAEYDLRRLPNVGFAVGMLGDRLMEVSLVKNPANPACRVTYVGTPRGYSDRYENLREGQDQEC